MQNKLIAGAGTLTRFTLLFSIAAILSGCATLFPPLPPRTPLAVAWRRYQACVSQSEHALTQCQNLRLAYNAQLTRAEKR
jgi:hypothetical protein